MIKHGKNMRSKFIWVSGVFAAIAMIWYIGAPSTNVSAVADTTSDAASLSALVTTNTQNQQAATATTYEYKQISISDAYVYFTTASFIALAGLILYASSYLIKQEARRSQYASRYHDYAKTTY